MKIALIVSVLVTSLALSVHPLQGKVVRVYDGDMIVILAEAKVKTIGLWKDANPIPPWEFRIQ